VLSELLNGWHVPAKRAHRAPRAHARSALLAIPTNRRASLHLRRVRCKIGIFLRKKLFVKPIFRVVSPSGYTY
jgi:hypothetical protein